MQQDGGGVSYINNNSPLDEDGQPSLLSHATRVSPATVSLFACCMLTILYRPSSCYSSSHWSWYSIQSVLSYVSFINTLSLKLFPITNYNMGDVQMEKEPVMFECSLFIVEVQNSIFLKKASMQYSKSHCIFTILYEHMWGWRLLNRMFGTFFIPEEIG